MHRMRTGRHLWSFIGTSQGRSIREIVMAECERSKPRCISHWPKSQSNLDANLTDLQTGHETVLAVSLNSTFCVQPPGSTISRRGIIDALVLGCIPVLTLPQQLMIWEGTFSRRELLSMAVYIPQILLMGKSDTFNCWNCDPKVQTAHAPHPRQRD